ncbi:helix-turn-helix transcriptional regulator [Natronorarus salvus]|uniref:helix-turn-helix transcriptional regulator n=1 Tax=Natronorarus salvus TaxID=3117733 RepID=UPI002F26C620
MSRSFESDLLGLLATRSAFVERLRSGATDKPTLEADLNVSRSTVDRAVRDLETAGLAERRDGTVRLTVVGRLIAEEFRSLVDVVSDAANAKPVLDPLDPDAPLSSTFLDGAAVYPSTAPAPYDQADRIEERLCRADRLRAFTKVISYEPISQLLSERVVAGGMEFEVIYEAPILDYLERERAAERREMFETGRYRPLGVETLPYGMLLIDGPDGSSAVITTYDETRTFRGMLVNEREAAVEWATDLYTEYREDATDVSDRFR